MRLEDAAATTILFTHHVVGNALMTKRFAASATFHLIFVAGEA